MKTIFFSDVHKDLISLKKLLEIEKGVFYCLGDTEISSELLEKYNIISVRGNCDISKLPDNLIIELDESKVLLTHGHLYNVKYTLDNIYYQAKSLCCNIAIFGHTHMITRVEEDVLLLNPGSLRDSKSYLVYENNQFKVKYL